MKLITANIWGGRIVYKLPEFLQNESPDIVWLQEVNDVPGDMGGVFESLDTLQQKCNFSEKFMAADLQFRYQNRDATYGIAMLSRLPLANKDVVFVQGEFYENYDDNEVDGDHPRNFQHAAIETSGKTIHIINFHGAFIHGSKEGNADTLRHVQTILDYTLPFRNEPIIIVGDFNLVPESESIRLLSEHFRNLPVEYGITSTYSSVLHSFNFICDYIFVNEQVNVHAVKVSEQVVSDHKPLVLDFSV